MNKLEVFFDYACPFCLKGHTNLCKLIDYHPEIEIIWCPCEIYARPENKGYHSDLAIQGMFYALHNNVDIWAYHTLMYNATIKDKVNIEDIDILTNIVGKLVNKKDFRLALSTNKYRKMQQDANKYAFETSGILLLPSYRMNGKKLDSIIGIGVPKTKLSSFMNL